MAKLSEFLLKAGEEGDGVKWRGQGSSAYTRGQVLNAAAVATANSAAAVAPSLPALRVWDSRNRNDFPTYHSS